MVDPVVLGIGAFLVCLAFTYRLGYSAGERNTTQLYTQHPPRCRHRDCLCIPGAMIDNPRCRYHGESTAAQSGG